MRAHVERLILQIKDRLRRRAGGESGRYGETRSSVRERDRLPNGGIQTGPGTRL